MRLLIQHLDKAKRTEIKEEIDNSTKKKIKGFSTPALVC
jgi:hypothetical protein